MGVFRFFFQVQTPKQIHSCYTCQKSMVNPQNPKPQTPTKSQTPNPKPPKSKTPKSKPPKIQNPKPPNPKPHEIHNLTKSKSPKIQNHPKSKTPTEMFSGYVPNNCPLFNVKQWNLTALSSSSSAVFFRAKNSLVSLDSVSKHSFSLSHSTWERRKAAACHDWCLMRSEVINRWRNKKPNRNQVNVEKIRPLRESGEPSDLV